MKPWKAGLFPQLTKNPAQFIFIHGFDLRPGGRPRLNILLDSGEELFLNKAAK
jgi:hypothetical protein